MDSPQLSRVLSCDFVRDIPQQGEGFPAGGMLQGGKVQGLTALAGKP
jgi:hypothetical protein